MKITNILIATVISTILMSCGGGNSSSNQTRNGTDAFNKSTLSVQQGKSGDLILSLEGGNNVGTDFTITSSNTNVATTNVPNCTLSSGGHKSSYCNIIIHGKANGDATISASANGFPTVTANVTVQTSKVPGSLIFSKPSESVAVGSENHVDLILFNSSGESIDATITSNNSNVTPSPTVCHLSSGAGMYCPITLIGNESGNSIITASASPNYESKMIVYSLESSNIKYGDIQFNQNSLKMTPGMITTVELQLLDSTGIVNDVVTIESIPGIADVSRTTCKLSSTLNKRSCVINIAAESIGTGQIKARSIYNGHVYKIAPINISVGYNKFSISTSLMGMTQTIYAGTNYGAMFTFTNNSTTTINNMKAIVTYGGQIIDGEEVEDTCVSLPAGQSCTVNIFDLNIPNPSSPHDISYINVKLVDNYNNYLYSYQINIAAIPFVQNYASYRLSNVLEQDLWLVALGVNENGQATVKFTPTGEANTLLGSLLDPSASYESGQILVPNTPLGLVFYQPNYSIYAPAPNTGKGGLMYVSLESPVYEPHGNVGINLRNPSDPNQNIIFSVYEPNVFNAATSGQFLANLDTTAINFYGVTQTFWGVATSSNINLDIGMSPQYSSLSTSEMFDQIQQYLQTWPNFWGIESSFVKSSNGSWIRLYGLANYYNQYSSTNPNGLDPNFYNNYVNKLWDFYQQERGNYIYIDANEISQNSNCTLRAYIPTGENRMIVESAPGSICPQNAGTGYLPFYWTKFTINDFVGGASTAASTLWGPNGSYQSMGKYVSAGQSVGFLPYCSQPQFVYGPSSFNESTVQSKYWTNQYSSCLGYTSDDVINQYDKILHKYVPSIYGWTYDDALDISSEVTTDPTLFGFTLKVHKFK